MGAGKSTCRRNAQVTRIHPEHLAPEDESRSHRMLGWVILYCAVAFAIALGVLVWLLIP